MSGVADAPLVPMDVVTTPARRAAFEAAGHWRSETLAGLLSEHAARNGDRPAVIDCGGERSHSYRQLDEDSGRVAAWLWDAGVRAHDVVSVQLPNWYETVVIDLAILKVGAVLNTMLPIYRSKELRHMLTVGRVGVIFTPATYRGHDHHAMVEGLRSDLPDLRHHVLVEDPEIGGGAFERWLAACPPARALDPVDAAAVSELLFTSGTEAAPKAVMHTEQTTCFGARVVGESHGLRDDDVVWMPSPIGHSTGFNYGVRMGLYHGLPVVLQERWSAEEAAALVERFRCSYSVAATTFVSDLVRHAQEHRCDLSSLRLFGSGGATVPPEVVDAADGCGMTVLRLYGSTEVLIGTWNRPQSSRHARRDTDGPPAPHTEIELRDDAGLVQTHAPGEIFVRGPSTSVGFFADPERTASTYDADGWVRTGDLGEIDDEGNLTIVGRKKEIIIRGGLNIAPREIEELIAQHDAIAEIAVVGVPDARLGEITCACVVLRDGAQMTLDELVGFLRASGLATFKLPQRLVILDELPKTATGKIRKVDLAAHASAVATSA